MRTLFYIIVFITPTVLVLVFRQDIQNYLQDKGILGSSSAAEGPVQGKVASSSPEAPPAGAEPDPGAVGQVSVPPEGQEDVFPTQGDIDRQVAAKYPLPSFKNLEDIVGQWKKVPESAYPKMVTLRKPVDLELIINGKVGGKSTLRVGQQAYPIALEGATLMVSGSPGDASMKGAIAVDDTDFKEQIRQKYEAWKTRQEGRVHKLRKEEKQRLLAGGGEGSEDGEVPADEASSLGKEPSVAADGTVPVMVASIKAGQVKEIELGKIAYWRWNGYEEIGGTGYWTGVVGYTANTIFGEINAEGKALIRNGRVIKWIYSGSEEEIR